jgi:hypothetical protein
MIYIVILYKGGSARKKKNKKTKNKNKDKSKKKKKKKICSKEPKRL